MSLGRTIAELTAGMSQAEYLDWQVFDTLEPIGFHRADHHVAALSWAALTPHCKESLTVADLMPFDEGRFDAPIGEEDEPDFDLDNWLSAAERRGIAVSAAAPDDG